MVESIKNSVMDLVEEWNKLIEKEKRKKMKRLTQDEFINKCIEVHGDRFDYTKTKYINIRTNIIIICRKHGDKSIKPDNHIRQKQGCFDCFLDKHKLTLLSDERVNNLKRVHNSKYQYNDLSVNKGFINIECPDHGVFTQYLYFHEYGHGCTQCNSSSRGEDCIKNYLDNMNIRYQRNYIFKDCKNKKGLRFDFYIPCKNMIVEYDGEHHYKENKYFGDGNLEYMKENDKIKNDYCLDNNITLIRIPYFDFKNIETILNLHINI